MKTEKKEMTVREMAQKGGLATKKRHPDHFRKIKQEWWNNKKKLKNESTTERSN